MIWKMIGWENIIITTSARYFNESTARRYERSLAISTTNNSSDVARSLATVAALSVILSEKGQL